MKFTKKQLQSIISEGIRQGMNLRETGDKGSQKDSIPKNAPGDVQRQGRYIDALDGVPEFLEASALFIEYLLEFKEEKANIGHLRKAILSKFDQLGIDNKGLANLFATIIMKAGAEAEVAQKEGDSDEGADEATSEPWNAKQGNALDDFLGSHGIQRQA